jgi:hypothetical protein
MPMQSLASTGRVRVLSGTSATGGRIIRDAPKSLWFLGHAARRRAGVARPLRPDAPPMQPQNGPSSSTPSADIWA